jgi:hypothetical protein
VFPLFLLLPATDTVPSKLDHTAMICCNRSECRIQTHNVAGLKHNRNRKLENSFDCCDKKTKKTSGRLMLHKSYVRRFMFQFAMQ